MLRRRCLAWCPVYCPVPGTLAVLLPLLLPFAFVSPIRAAPQIQARAAVLLDMETGRVLYAKRAYEHRAPASLTKVVTALVALDHGGLNQMVTVSPQAARTPEASLGLAAGDKLTLEHLIQGMLWRSGNDAAVAIAEHVAGSVAAFSRLMNAKAAALGAQSTQFVNPHGLDAPGHYSTAYDLALIARAALSVPRFAEMVRQGSSALTWGGMTHQVANINSFLWRYQGATGVKTGYTSQAGYSLIASAQKDGQSLIAVLLNEPTSDARWTDAALLLDYGFSHRAALLEKPALDTQAYVVRPGDTLWEIARRFGVTIQAIVELNSLTWPDLIRPGQRLLIPTLL